MAPPFRKKPMVPNARVRVCPVCGVLLDPSDTRCFQCGDAITSTPSSSLFSWARKHIPLQGEITSGILLANVSLFLLTWLLSKDKGILMSVDMQVLDRFGAKDTALILGHGEWWRLILSAFLHANFMHIFFNMMVLVSLGRAVEEFYGWERYLFFYVVSAIFADLASMWMHPQYLGIGASGAIMGLAGVLLAYSVRNWSSYGRVMGKGLLRWIGSILLIGFVLGSFVDNAAHIGGLIAGFLIALPFPAGRAKGTGQKFLDIILGWGSLFLIGYSFLLMALAR